MNEEIKAKENAENQEPYRDNSEAYWIFALIMLAPLFSAMGGISQTEKEIAELKGKMEILERML